MHMPWMTCYPLPACQVATGFDSSSGLSELEHGTCIMPSFGLESHWAHSCYRHVCGSRAADDSKNTLQGKRKSSVGAGKAETTG